jgi:gliding motility-associated-like protein
VAGNTNGLVYTYWKDAAATIPLTDPGAIGAAGTYYIKGSNVGGCSVIKSVTVTLSEPTIVAPNAFSPNGDGINDVWNIPLLSLYNNCSVEIYNRLGQLIYKSTGTYTPWNGKYNGIDQPVDTYYYIIKPDPTLPPVGGSVTIVR